MQQKGRIDRLGTYLREKWGGGCTKNCTKMVYGGQNEWFLGLGLYSLYSFVRCNMVVPWVLVSGMVVLLENFLYSVYEICTNRNP